MMFTVYVGVEGFVLKTGFIVKQLSFLYEGNGEYENFLFSPPKMTLSASDLKTVNWCTKNLHNLDWDEGLIPYSSVQHIMNSLTNCHIVCHGHAAERFVRTMLPNTRVTDTTSLGHKLPTEVYHKTCGRRHAGRNCALSKAYYISTFQI